MKKMVALLLVAALLLPLVPAFADIGATAYTQDEKFFAQLRQSGYRGSVTFSVNGDVLPDESLAPWLALLPTWNVNFSRTVKAQNEANGTETQVSVLQSGQEILHTDVCVDKDGIIYVQSPLLSDPMRPYAVESGFDPLILLSDAVNGSTWPSMLHILSSLRNAPEEWHTRASQLLVPYQTSMTNWLQTYAVVSTERDTLGGIITTMDYEIPFAAVKQEMKQLLVDLYADQPTLSLLKEVLSAREQAAYLQQSMLFSFLSMFDQLAVDNPVTIKRQFDLTGKALYESITLPFAKGQMLDTLTLVRLPQENDTLTRVLGVVAADAPVLAGVSFDVSFLKQEDIVTGDVSLVLPAPDTFAVAEERAVAFSFNLYTPEPVDTADTLNSLYARSREISMLVRPAENMAPMSLTIQSKLYSTKPDRRSVTHLDGTAVLTNMDTEGSLTVSLSSKTAVAWQPVLLDTMADSALRLDLLTDTARRSLVSTLAQRLVQQLAAVLPITLPAQTAPTATQNIAPVYTLPPQPDGSVG